MPRKQTPSEIITVTEVGKRAGICPDTIRELMRVGKFPVGFAYEMPSGRWAYKIPREAFERWMRGEQAS